MMLAKNIALLALVLSFLSRAGSLAHAEESTGAILVLGVVQEDRLDSRLTESLERYLGSTEHVISSRELHGEERKCREPRCLYELAQRKNAAMLIGANVTRTDKSEVELGLYLLHSATKTWRRTGDLVPIEQVAERLNQLARQLLRGPVVERTRAKSPALRSSSPLLAPDALIRLLRALPPERVPISPRRKFAGISLLLFGGLALGAAVALSALAPSYTTPARCFANYYKDCLDHASPAMAVGYSAGGGLALAGILTLAIPPPQKVGL